MGRQKVNNVYRSFNLLANGTAECKICNKILKSQHGANLLKHLKIHTEVYEETKRLNKLSLPLRQELVTNSNKDAFSDHSDSEQSTTLDPENELWGFFDKEPHNRARCSMCSAVLKRDSDILYKHLKEQHSRISENLEYRDHDENYTEVIYLEDPVTNSETEAKKIKFDSVKQERPESPKLKRSKRRHSYKEPLRVNNSQNILPETPKKDIKDVHEEEIDNFGKYITGLLKAVPQAICTKLQMDIVNMVMTAKLKSIEQTPMITINGTIEVQGDKDAAGGERMEDDNRENEETEGTHLDTTANSDQKPEARKGPDKTYTTQKKPQKRFSYTQELSINLTDQDIKEVENFGKYITCLLQSVSNKDIGAKLQMDIVSLIMTARLKANDKSVLTISETTLVNKGDLLTAGEAQ